MMYTFVSERQIGLCVCVRERERERNRGGGLSA